MRKSTGNFWQPEQVRDEDSPYIPMLIGGQVSEELYPEIRDKVINIKFVYSIM